MKRLKLYIVEFNKNDIIKPKKYPLECTVKDNH